MKISEAFAGKFLKAADLPQPRTFLIKNVTQELMGEEKESKPVLRFQGEQRGLVLNKCNSFEIAGWYGDDTRSWIGQPVELFPTTTFLSGRQFPCIRVRRPAMQQPVQNQAPALVQPQQMQAPRPQQMQAPQQMPPPQQMQAPQPQQIAAPVQAPNLPFDA